MLSSLVASFEVLRPDVDEQPYPGEPARGLVQRLALSKLRAVLRPDCHVVAADTVAALEGRIFGQPANLEEARSNLAFLAGRRFEVFTATAFKAPTGPVCSHLSTNQLAMKSWGDGELADYLASGLWQGRAGGFSIAAPESPVTLLDGELDAVRGLSTAWLNECLRKAGYAV